MLFDGEICEYFNHKVSGKIGEDIMVEVIRLQRNDFFIQSFVPNVSPSF